MAEFTPDVSVQDDVMTFLLSSPAPQEIIAFQASEVAQERLRYLLDARREGSISPAEDAELEEASQINHFVILLKAKAHEALNTK